MSDIETTPKTSKPWYKKWWGITLITLGVLVVIGQFVPDEESANTTSAAPVATATPFMIPTSAPVQTPVQTQAVQPAPVVTEPAKPEPAPEPPQEEPESNLTAGQENAIAKAESYLEFTSFSRKGLIEQLEFEGFSTADAKFAVDYLKIDWNEQAAKKAQSYLEFSSFSKQGLIEQLVFEGFTQAQAKYGADKAYN